jgi:hypothetical protein
MGEWASWRNGDSKLLRLSRPYWTRRLAPQIAISPIRPFAAAPPGSSPFASHQRLIHQVGKPFEQAVFVVWEVLGENEHY